MRIRSGRRGRKAALLALLLTVAPVAAAGRDAAGGIAGRTLTLEECVALGLARDPGTEIARQNLAAAQQRVIEARAGLYPSFKVSAGYTYTGSSGAAAAGGPDLFDTRIAVRQLLYDGGQTSHLVAGARLGIGSQESDLLRTRLDAVFGIRSAFFEVLRRRDLAEVARGALQSSERHAGQAQELYREGLAPRSDVIKADVQVSNARLEIIRADNALLLAKAALSAAMGLPVTTEFQVAEPELLTGAPALSLQEALAAAPALRPELAAVKARQEAAAAAVRQARSGLNPTVGVDAFYGLQGDDVLPEDTKWSVGLSIGIPLFERRVVRSRVSQAEAGRSGLQALEAQVLRAIELEVQQAWLLVQEARERQSVTKKIREQAEEDTRVSEGRYQEGLGTMLEVIDARTALTQAGTNAVIARYDSALARARLDRALGREVPEEGR